MAANRLLLRSSMKQQTSLHRGHGDPTVATMKIHRAIVVGILTCACHGSSEGQAVVVREPTAVEATASTAIVVRLSPVPAERERELRWSPKANSVALEPSPGGAMRGAISLGATGTPIIAVELRRSEAGGPIDRLAIDLDRNGAFDEAIMECTPSESRGKLWSSFTAVLSVPVTDPWDQRASVPYSVSLWYVYDPVEPDAAPVLRWSRRGFYTGSFQVEGQDAIVMLCDRAMDGVFDRRDSWALAPTGDPGQAMQPSASRGVSDHGWLGEQAFRVATVDPSGLLLVLVPHDPGVTRAAEFEQRDRLAIDRRARRSGATVPFMHDFAEALALAQQEGKRLLIDFETTWCGPCKQMDRWVYTADDVVAAAADVIAVKVDGDLSRDVTARFQVRAFPTMILLSAKGTEIARNVGYLGVAETVAFLAHDE